MDCSATNLPIAQINIMKDSTVVIICDSNTYDHVKEKILSKVNLHENNITLINLSSFSDFFDWYKNHNSNMRLQIFSIHGEGETPIVENKNTVFLTLKNIETAEYQICCDSPDLILIDDDVSLGLAWEMRAEMMGKNICYFSSPHYFNKIMNFFSKDTKIFIDSDLGDVGSGEEYAKEFYEYGFKKIFLATGKFGFYDFEKPSWIAGIVGKEPPF